MATKPLPTPEELRQLLDYNPETGILKWRKRPSVIFSEGARSAKHKANNWNVRWAGKPALTNIGNNGYRRGPVMGVYVIAHRAIWAIMTGTWSKQQIDHLNGDKLDNRWVNLREVTHTINGRNAKRKSNNTSGYNGVCWFAARRKWCAHITIDRRHRTLGYFDKIEDAAEARRAAEVKHGFTATHGRRT